MRLAPKTDQRPILFLVKACRPFLIHCPKCDHRASATTEGRAMTALAEHYKAKHWPIPDEAA